MHIPPNARTALGVITMAVGVGGLALFGISLVRVVVSLSDPFSRVDFLSPLGIQSWAPLAIGALLAAGFVLAGFVLASFEDADSD